MDMPKPQILKLIDYSRAKKSKQEIFHIKKSAIVLDKVFYKVKKYIKPGLTELEVALFLEKQMLKLGIKEAAFTPIVAAGLYSANIHHWPTKRKLQLGDMVMIDFGAVVNGYCSDMTRTLFLGRPTVMQRRIYQAVLRAQIRGLNIIKSGITGHKVDQTVRNVLKKTKLNSKFTHNLGHGVGKYIHEWPRLGKNSRDVLKTNMVITVEPGVYIKGWGGIRIEDMALITSFGCKILTHAPKDLESIIIYP